MLDFVWFFNLLSIFLMWEVRVMYLLNFLYNIYIEYFFCVK